MDERIVLLFLPLSSGHQAGLRNKFHNRSSLFGLIRPGIGVWDRLWLFIGGRAVSEEGGKGPKSMNLSAAFPGTGQGRSLYLMAHYDSKSQSFNLYLRTGLFLLGTVSGGLFCLWIWIHFLQGLMGTRKAAIPVFFQFSFFLSLIINLFCLFSRLGTDRRGPWTMPRA